MLYLLPEKYQLPRASFNGFKYEGLKISQAKSEMNMIVVALSIHPSAYILIYYKNERLPSIIKNSHTLPPDLEIALQLHLLGV